MKFSIDVKHEVAWRGRTGARARLELSFFGRKTAYRVHAGFPFAYLNGGPRDYLSWVIESKDKDFAPATCAEWLEGRLPRPVSDLKQWSIED